ncbi:hypothetical protein [uncultured Alistipes sp.]|uniref:hypothetical protein n=1 Tax=uncultured Alistipes sp. TaxID=538949 RepID=UPI0026662181|nr:hypothetical protein [uncultured Alistipes sp.]
MKRALLISVLSLLAATGLRVQNVALGERVPELKSVEWLDGAAPAAAPLTYIEFFHSSNSEALRSLDRLKETVEALGGRLRAVVVMRERTERALAMVAPYRSGRIGVAYDADGRIFDAFGVTYVSFGVLTDAKNRALWMGNTLRITPDFIEQTVQ